LLKHHPIQKRHYKIEPWGQFFARVFTQGFHQRLVALVNNPNATGGNGSAQYHHHDNKSEKASHG
jgi:hypothetical protein